MDKAQKGGLDELGHSLHAGETMRELARGNLRLSWLETKIGSGAQNRF